VPAQARLGLIDGDVMIIAKEIGCTKTGNAGSYHRDLAALTCHLFKRHRPLIHVTVQVMKGYGRRMPLDEN
jgi:hypothetical protein